MTEPTTATPLAIVATGFSVAALFPGMDGNAVIGAFAGSALVALHARDVSTATRVIYLVVSWIMGYLGAPLAERLTGLQETGVAAFLAAALIVALTLQLLERVKDIDILGWLRRGGGTP